MSKISKISVVMPVYNTVKYVGESIESVLNQTFQDFEFIIIDDGSDDGSYETCKKFANQDDRIKLYQNEENMGVVKTRNRLLDKVSEDSKYIAIIDADDIAMKNRLQKQFDFLESHKDYSIVGSNLEIINAQGETTGHRQYPKDHKEVQKKIYKKNPLAQPASMIRKKDRNVVGKYNENFERAQDYELWFRFFDKGYQIGNIQENLMKYRVFGGQGKSKHLKLTLRNTIKIQKRYIFQKKYFTIGNLLHFVLENLLLVLPNKFILKLFKLLEYKNVK